MSNASGKERPADPRSRLVTIGPGGLIVKGSAGVEVPPPGPGVKTVMLAVPTAAMSAAGIVASSRVDEINDVVRSVPFQRTRERLLGSASSMKFVPFTVSVNWPPPLVADVGLSDQVVGT